MSNIIGLNAILKRGTAGATATTAMTGVANVTVSYDSSTAETTHRANAGWRSHEQTLRDITISFDMPWDSASTDFTAIKSAWLAGSKISLLILDDDISGTSQGIDLDVIVTGFTHGQPIDGVQTVNVTCKPNCAARNPAWYTLS